MLRPSLLVANQSCFTSWYVRVFLFTAQMNFIVHITNTFNRFYRPLAQRRLFEIHITLLLY